MSWEPIETAPRDGTVVLLYISEDNAITTASFVNESYRSWWALEYSGSYAEDSDLNAEPTHWMPLPPTPSE